MLCHKENVCLTEKNLTSPDQRYKIDAVKANVNMLKECGLKEENIDASKVIENVDEREQVPS